MLTIVVTLDYGIGACGELAVASFFPHGWYHNDKKLFSRFGGYRTMSTCCIDNHAQRQLSNMKRMPRIQHNTRTKGLEGGVQVNLFVFQQSITFV